MPFDGRIHLRQSYQIPLELTYKIQKELKKNFLLSCVTEMKGLTFETPSDPDSNDQQNE